MSYYQLVPNDFAPITNPYLITDETRPYVCKDCGYFNWYKAVKDNVSTSSKWPLKMPEFFCADNPPIFIVNQRFKDALKSLVNGDAEFYPITDHPDNFMLLPKNIIWPPDNVPLKPERGEGALHIESQSAKCNTCGHYSQVCILRDRYIVPDGISFAGLFLGVGYGFILIASEKVALALKKDKFKGLTIRKNSFAN